MENHHFIAGLHPLFRLGHGFNSFCVNVYRYKSGEQITPQIIEMSKKSHPIPGPVPNVWPSPGGIADVIEVSLQSAVAHIASPHPEFLVQIFGDGDQESMKIENGAQEIWVIIY